MELQIGIKSDPVEYRYSFEWLFSLMNNHGIRFLQLGTFFELYSLPDSYFVELKEQAQSFDITINSVFTSHRELGGFFTGNRYMELAARKNYERLIEIAAILGAEYAGSNPGAVYRDQMEKKETGIKVYLQHMKELMAFARSAGLKGITIEPMSCSAEPPATPIEIEWMLTQLHEWNMENRRSTVPVYLCGDISHGFADRKREIIHTNRELFIAGIHWMCEFHIKNTDAIFNSTFGFSQDEREMGIVDLSDLYHTIIQNDRKWPVEKVVGYLEIGGPKTGRDYTDYLLEEQLTSSIIFIKSVFLN